MLKKDIETFAELHSKLISIRSDISVLSSKKPNDQLNEFKLKYINRILEGINKLIGDFKPDSEFCLFELESLPTNSDVLLILNLYVNAMKLFKDHNSQNDAIDLDWGRTEQVWNVKY